jgi:hypothetical protein
MQQSLRKEPLEKTQVPIYTLLNLVVEFRYRRSLFAGGTGSLHGTFHLKESHACRFNQQNAKINKA